MHKEIFIDGQKKDERIDSRQTQRMEDIGNDVPQQKTNDLAQITMRIQCPECSQRFDVTEDFLGKTVECGSCDKRFKVTEDELVKEKKKFYPGEKKDTHLERFGYTPARGAGAGVDFAQAHYQPDVSAVQVGPPRPRRTIATLAGVSLMILVIIVFLLAGGKEGAMRDMETMNRFILVGFTALLGGALVVYGSVKNRRMGYLIAFVLGAILLVLPVLFPANPTKASEEPIVFKGGSGEGLEGSMGKVALDTYLIDIGYDPIKNAIENNPPNTVVGIYLRNARKRVREKITSYLYEATGKLSRGIDYERGDDGSDGLVLLDKQKKTIDEIAALCLKFGRIEKIDKKLRLIDVSVERAKMDSLDQFKILDPESMDFEVQNLKALNSFDRSVKLQAVKRLAGAKPKAHRDDITQQLLKMLPESDTELQLEIIAALKIWALPESGAGPKVLDAVKKIHKEGKVSKEAMEFLIENQVAGSELILMELWEKDPVVWYDTFIKLGEGAQVLILPKMGGLDSPHFIAACDILGKTGTKACVSELQGMTKEKKGQEKKSLQAAIDEIKKRP